MLREDQLAVDPHIEDAPAALDQVGALPELLFNFVRQTGGTWLVVSNHAVFDGDRHNGRSIAQARCVRSPQGLV
jgi:hypothetical protein